MAMPRLGKGIVRVIESVPKIPGLLLLIRGVPVSADAVSSLEGLNGHNVGSEIDIFEECDAHVSSIRAHGDHRAVFEPLGAPCAALCTKRGAEDVELGEEVFECHPELAAFFLVFGASLNGCHHRVPVSLVCGKRGLPSGGSPRIAQLDQLLHCRADLELPCFKHGVGVVCYPRLRMCSAEHQVLLIRVVLKLSPER